MKRGAGSLSAVVTLLAGVVFVGSLCLASDTVTVTDLAKRTVITPKNPWKIICLSPGTFRLICYLGAQDKLVGVEQFEKTRPVGRPYWTANPQLAGLPSIGPGGPKSINIISRS